MKMSGRGYHMTRFSYADAVRHHWKEIKKKTQQVESRWMPASYIRWNVLDYTNWYSEDETEDGAELYTTVFWEMKRKGGKVFITGSFNKRFLTRKAIEKLGIEPDKKFVEFVDVEEKEVFPK